MTYFHPILGPDIILASPNNALDNLDVEFINSIKSLLDSAETNSFFTHSFKENLKTVNYFFTIKSEWARGREEMVMITSILREQDPNLDTYQNEFIKFVGRIKKEIRELHQVFYFRNPPEGFRNIIKEKLENLKKKFDKMQSELSLIKIRTYGSMTPVSFINEQKVIHIPSIFVQDLNDIIKKTNIYRSGKSKVFSVYQYRDDRIKIEMIPVKCDVILKVTLILNENSLSPEIIRKISMILTDFKLKLIYTSGICAADKGKCVYEVYLDYSEKIDINIFKEKLSEIDPTTNIKIVLIE